MNPNKQRTPSALKSSSDTSDPLRRNRPSSRKSYEEVGGATPQNIRAILIGVSAGGGVLIVIVAILLFAQGNESAAPQQTAPAPTPPRVAVARPAPPSTPTPPGTMPPRYGQSNPDALAGNPFGSAPMPGMGFPSGPGNGGSTESKSDGASASSPAGPSVNNEPAEPLVTAGETGEDVLGEGEVGAEDPAIGGNPFAQLSSEVDLAFESQFAQQAKFDLGSVSNGGCEDWQISIDSGAADLQGVTFAVGEPSSDGAVVRWPIHVEAPSSSTNKQSKLLGESIAGSTPLAHLQVNESELSLAVEAGQHKRRAVQLRNCILHLTMGMHSHSMQLRKSQTTRAVTLNLEDASESVDFTIKTTPAEDKLTLQLGTINEAGQASTLTPATLEVGINEDLAIAVPEWQGAYIEMRIVKSQDSYRLKVLPRYELNDRRQSLTREKVTSELKRLINQRSENLQAVNAAEARLRDVPGEIRSIQSRRPRSPQEASMLAVAVSKLQKEGKKLQSRIRRIRDATPQLEDNLKRLQLLGPIIDRLHLQAKIPFKLLAKAESGYVTLVNAS